MIRVEAKLYATLRKYYPKVPVGKPVLLEVDEGCTLAGLLENLRIPEDKVQFIFVNNVQQELDYVLRSGDKPGIFPPIAGG